MVKSLLPQLSFSVHYMLLRMMIFFRILLSRLLKYRVSHQEGIKICLSHHSYLINNSLYFLNSDKIKYSAYIVLTLLQGQLPL